MTALPPPRDYYRDSVAHALGGFQLLEEGLKTHIDVCYETVRQLLVGKLHFGFEKSEVQEAPLGRLLQLFSRVCANQELVVELRALVKHRNTAAHQAFVCLYGPGTSDAEYVTMATKNLELSTTISTLLPRLHQETVGVLAILEAHRNGESGRAG